MTDISPADWTILYQSTEDSGVPYNGRVLASEDAPLFTASLLSRRAYNCHTRLKQFWCLMMVIDGGTFDTQSGISTGKSWLSTFNYNKSTWCGRTVPLGNNNGEIMWDPEVDINVRRADWSADALKDPSKQVMAFNWRGFENPFGNIGEYEDGIIPCTKYIDGNESSHPGYHECNVLGGFSDTMTATYVYKQYPTNYNAGTTMTNTFIEYRPMSSYWWRDHPFPASGWIRRWDPVTFLPTVVGGSATTYCCDNVDGWIGNVYQSHTGYPRTNRNPIDHRSLYGAFAEEIGMMQFTLYSHPFTFSTTGTRLQI